MSYSPNYSSSSSSNPDPEVLRLVARYEARLAAGESVFFESDAFQDIIDYYDRSFEAEKALQAADKAVEQHPFCAQLYLYRAQLLLDAGRFDEAQANLQQGGRFEPNNPDFQLTQADWLFRTGDLSAARTILNRLRREADEDLLHEIAILEANILEEQKRFGAALEVWEAVVRHEPDNEWLLSRAWACAEQLEQPQRAIDLFRTAIDLQPYAKWAWYYLGFVYMEMGQYEQAFEAFDYAVVIDEGFDLAHRDRISALLSLENYAEALRLCLEYKESFAVDAEWYEYMGECKEGLGELEQARAFYLQSAQIDAGDGNAYYRLGCCYGKEGKWAEALHAFDTAHQIDAENEVYCLAIAEAHYELGDSFLANEYLALAVSKNPEEAYPWLCYIEFLILENDLDLAFELLDQARMLCPDKSALDCAQAALHFLSGDYQAAWLQTEELRQTLPDALARIEAFSPKIEKHPVWLRWHSEK